MSQTVTVGKDESQVFVTFAFPTLEFGKPQVFITFTFVRSKLGNPVLSKLRRETPGCRNYKGESRVVKIARVNPLSKFRGGIQMLEPARLARQESHEASVLKLGRSSKPRNVAGSTNSNMAVADLNTFIALRFVFSLHQSRVSTLTGLT